MPSAVTPKTNPPAPKPSRVQRPWPNRLSRVLWAAFAAAAGFFFLLPILVSTNFLFLFGKSPGLEELENPKVEQASELFTSDGVLIGRYYRENRSPVPLNKMAPVLIKALVATEDVRFYEHAGIDPQALVGSVYAALRGDKRGGSTLTQQLAKNLYKTRRGETRGLLGHVPVVGTLVAKMKEWLTAVELERRYTKEEILRMYLNTVEYGSNAFGIKVAAKTFFSTSPDSLTPEQAAVLVGVLNNPTAFNPRFHPEASTKRRNLVLQRMGQAGVLSAAEVKTLQAQPIVLRYQVEKHVDGPETYFRGAISSFVNSWCEKNGYDMYRDGLRIYTTIDSRMQAHAEDAVQKRMKILQRSFDNFWRNRNSNPWVDEDGKEIPDFIETQMKRTEVYKRLAARYKGQPAKLDSALHAKRPMKVFTWKHDDNDTTLVMSPLDSLAYYKHFLQAGMMTMDPYTGYVKAWVGGLNYRFFQYDHVKQGRRQAGSTFKPFVYLTAIDKGYAPCDRIRDQRVTIKYVENGKPMEWQPDNVTREYTGINMTLRHAMARSVNSVTAQLTERVGWNTVADYAHKVGIRSPLLPVPSIGLGSGGDVSVYEMVDAYSTFVNGGFRTEPLIVTRIEDRNGNVIKQFDPQQKRVIPAETAWLMLYMLRGGMDEPGGTSQALWEYELWKKDNQIGGKTGTTSNYSDGWYMGVTKDLVSGVWVGGEDRSIHFFRTQQGEGGRMALPIFGTYMEKLYQDPELDITMGPFPKYPGKISKKYICYTEEYDRPKRQAVQIDSIAVDNLLEQINSGEVAVPDSLKTP
ncbi:penicillin-binding protein [Hymenobacter busanensis]|uniref:Penicillin-binding protein n=1 Tax=Hymenobacter busanensis TaxID=2607656 RepID=A0A7L5A089_9BACT|nr:transglycosylase domain-containing protein [Hymenobacter busanensis]KAA9338375.1 penicillin-binding protein [Hymenobacter busanensis]QHJ09199.1 penicillin-binding protein [Hymenobacter busanensis]